MMLNNDTEVDLAIVAETNKLLEELKKEMIELNEISLLINEQIVIDGEKINKIEENIVETDILITDTMPLLEQAIEHKDKYVIAKVVSGIVIGGVLCTGVGAIFGAIPALIGLGIGSGSGGALGYATSLIKF